MDDHSVRITSAGDVVEEAPARPVKELLDVDPADLAAWLPEVEAGNRVLLPDVPGSLPIVREAVAYGVVGLVSDGADAEQVEHARAVVSRRAVDDAELAALTTVLRDRLAEGRGATPDPRTAPRVLLVAFNRQELGRISTPYQRLETWGAQSYVLTSATLLRSQPRMLPPGATVLSVPDPGGAWWPSRVERLLVLKGPRLLTGGLERALTVAARRAPGPAARVARQALPTATRLNRARREVSGRVHARAWSPLLVRVKPALVARDTYALLPSFVGDPRDLDLLCAPGTDSLSLVWRLLRALPDLRASAAMSGQAVAEVVRERTAALAATLDRG